MPMRDQTLSYEVTSVFSDTFTVYCQKNDFFFFIVKLLKTARDAMLP